jgi:hypothetical protein
MKNFFKKKKTIIGNCFFCNKEIYKETFIELKYNASDGDGSVKICPECSKDMIKMKESFFYNDTI